MTKKIKFQSKEYKFPERCFICGFLFKDENDKPAFIYFAISIEKNLDGCIGSYLKLIKTGSKEILQRISKNFLMVAELKLTEKIPLKKEFWDNPVFDYTELKRTEVLTKALDKPDFYNILITPNRGVTFAVAFAFLKSSQEELNLFMETSNWNVDPRATHSGVYEIEEVYGYDIESAEKTNRSKDVYEN